MLPLKQRFILILIYFSKSDRHLGLEKSKAIADYNIKVTENLKWFLNGTKHCGKKGLYWKIYPISDGTLFAGWSWDFQINNSRLKHTGISAIKIYNLENLSSSDSTLCADWSWDFQINNSRLKHTGISAIKIYKIYHFGKPIKIRQHVMCRLILRFPNQ